MTDIYLDVSTAALILRQAWQGLPPGRRLGTHPAQPSHFSTVFFFFEGTRRNRRQLGPGASESVENPDTSSSVSRHSSCSSFVRKTESEPRDLELLKLQNKHARYIKIDNDQFETKLPIEMKFLLKFIRRLTSSLVPEDRHYPWKPMVLFCR